MGDVVELIGKDPHSRCRPVIDGISNLLGEKIKLWQYRAAASS